MPPLGSFLLENVGKPALLKLLEKSLLTLRFNDIICNLGTPRDEWQLLSEAPHEFEKALSSIWNETIMCVMPRPFCITCHELLRHAFLTYFEDESVDRTFRLDCEPLLNRYLTRLDKIPLTIKASAPFIAAQASVSAMDDADMLYGFAPLQVFKNDFDLTISLSSILHAGFGKHANGRECLVYFQVVGPFTNDALTQAVDETIKIVGTLITLAAMLDHSNLDPPLDATSGQSILKWGREALENSSLVPALYHDGQLGSNYQFIPAALAAYWSRPPKKDVVSRRIRNAISLLCSANSPLDDTGAIQLALAVAAIESLVCQRGASISSQFSDHVASVLEPDPHLRGEAVKFMRKLYDARSSVLHGEAFDATLAQQADAKLIAAACLQAMVERREFTLKMEGTEETGKSLVEELSADRFTPGRLTGVDDHTYILPWQK